jgi:histone-lysine N-methyltransferase SETMAR
MMEHPTYNPDLVPSDFHVFGPMKEALRGRRLSSDKEVIGAVQNWLKTQANKFFFPDGIKSRMKRWNRCVEVEGDYVEK